MRTNNLHMMCIELLMQDNYHLLLLLQPWNYFTDSRDTTLLEPADQVVCPEYRVTVGSD